MTKKKTFIAPTVAKVNNEEIMAAACNETFIYTSAGGATSAGWARVCYHYRIPIPGTDKFGYKNDLAANAAIVIDLPPNAVFSTTKPETMNDGSTTSGLKYYEGGTWLSYTNGELGWDNFIGFNGKCHFI